MSAYLMASEHLSMLANAPRTFGLAAVPVEEALYGTLLDENLLSVGYRYPDASRISDWCDEGEAGYIYNQTAAAPSAEEALSLARSYDYQSCEHPTYRESFASQYITALRASLEALAKEEQAERARIEANAVAAIASAAIRLNAKSTAALIRKLLKGAFPCCKFSVVTERGSMVSSVRISWMDGPTTSAVDELVKCFEQGHFDGMTDSYNRNTGGGRFVVVNGVTYERGCNYVFTSRAQSPAHVARLIAQVATYYGLETPAVRVSNYDGAGAVWATTEQDAEAWAKTGHRWCDLVHQASQDRTRFTFATKEG